MSAHPHEIDALPNGLMAAQLLGVDPADGPARAPRPVALWICNDQPHGGHMSGTHAAIARWVACLRGDRFAGVDQPGTSREEGAPATFWVPSDTVVSPDRRWGLRNEDDLFGGVVPLAFVATKVVTHPLVSPSARAPRGWNPSLGPALADAVLPGYAVFDRDAALLAGLRLLRDGPVRLKAAGGIGGTGQVRAEDLTALETAVRSIDASSFDAGWVVERDLVEPRTLSVGQVRLAGMVASYVGTQRQTVDAGGRSVYGGSTLKVVPGDYDALAALALDDATMLAIQQARRYDAEVKRAYPGTFATRSNYDIAQGFDHAGRWRSGVLEQSWRIGGATGAELVALQAMREDPTLQRVDARTVEQPGRDVTLPAGAVLLYHGHDDETGWITKYAERIHCVPHGLPND